MRLIERQINLSYRDGTKNDRDREIRSPAIPFDNLDMVSSIDSGRATARITFDYPEKHVLQVAFWYRGDDHKWSIALRLSPGTSVRGYAVATQDSSSPLPPTPPPLIPGPNPAPSGNPTHL